MIYKFFKRLFDVICALLGIIGTSPIWIVSIILTEISDPGPLFYFANRVGKDNKKFKMWKFRSMRVDLGQLRIIKNHSRIESSGGARLCAD